VIPLFSRFSLTRAQAEEALGRDLTGDPSQGEKAALHALADLDFKLARDLLDGPDVADDFRALIEDRLDQAALRQGQHFVVSALVNGNAYDHYARLARLQGVPLSSVVGSAIERDFAGARALQQLDAEPILPTLITYLRELISLLRKADDDPELASQVARLVALQERLESSSPSTSELS
jgi:hypothetical protein